MPRTKSSRKLSAYRHRGFDCICGNLRMASRALTSVYDSHLKPCGLTVNQMAVLWCVLSREPAAMSEIAHTVVMDKTTVSRNMATLARRSLVKSQVGGDARQRLVSSTAKGRRTFVAALPAWEAAQAQIGAMMGKTNFSRLAKQTRNIAGLIAADR
jgi:DNA-binding MarR family transcriptional regulator